MSLFEPIQTQRVQLHIVPARLPLIIINIIVSVEVVAIANNHPK